MVGAEETVASEVLHRCRRVDRHLAVVYNLSEPFVTVMIVLWANVLLVRLHSGRFVQLYLVFFNVVANESLRIGDTNFRAKLVK